MSTENVKILLRRGFRDEITSTMLETGEMGFTTDTNQLFVGTDKALNSIQFDPFANAHAVIQSWLDSPDNPYPGLTVNEDLTIDLLNNEDIDVLLDAMRFYEQIVTITNAGSVEFHIGETLYQYWNDVTQDPSIVKQRRLGEILEVTDNANGVDKTLRLKVSEQAIYGWRYEHAETTSIFSETIIDGTVNDNDGGVGMLTIGVRDYGLENVDELHVPTSITYDNGVDVAGTLTYAAHDYTYEFESTDDPSNSRFIITFINLVKDGTNLVLTSPTHSDEFDGTIIPYATDTFVINPTYHKDTGDTPATRYVVRVDDVLQTESTDYTVSSTNFIFTTLPDSSSVVTIAYEIDKIVNEDGEVSFNVTFDDSPNFWLSTDRNYTKLNTNIKVEEVSGVSEFRGAYYGKERRNVEVVTENSFNQLFADQHLSSLDSATGLRSSLFRKTLKQRIHGPDKLKFGLEYKILDVGTNTDAQVNWNTVAGTTGVTYEVDDTFTSVDQVAMEAGQGSALTTQGTFLRYNKGVCTTFFIDYSLVQTDSTSKFLRVGQIKVINGVPQGINQVKLTDDNTEMWQDNSDDIAGLDEFSNIEFDTAINGDNIEINFTQDTGFETEISYTVKRWSM
jgi:hypothetical protein